MKTTYGILRDYTSESPRRQDIVHIHENEYERSSLSGKFRPARKAERLSDCHKLLPGEIEMAVKMRLTCPRTKRPRGALLYLDTGMTFLTV